MTGLVPVIHVVVYNPEPICGLKSRADATNLPAADLGSTWMTGTSPVMTGEGRNSGRGPPIVACSAASA